MAKTWVLDTETKGTGAHIAPLETDAERKPEQELALVTLEREPRRAVASVPAPTGPLKFKVVDVLGARLLAEDVDARAVVALLADMRSVLDARIYVRARTGERWRMLTLGEQKALWSFRQQSSAA